MADDKSIERLAAERAEWSGAEALRGQLVSLDDLRPHPDNPRRGDVAAIIQSLERFGQYRPIVARPDGTVLAGHHVMFAAQELGWRELAVTHVDVDEPTARALMLADNHLFELGSWDDSGLAALLRDQAEAGGLAGTGYPEGGDQLDALLRRLEPSGGNEFPPAEGGDEPEYRCPRCKYTWDGEPRPEAAG